MVFSGSLRRPRFSRASGMHLCIFRYFSIPVLANEKLQKLQFSLLRISILKLFNTCNSNFVLCGFGQKVRVREHFPQHKSGLWKTPSDHSSAWTSNFAQDFSHHFHMKRRRWNSHHSIVNCESAHTSNLDYAIKESERECKANQINRSWKELIELLEMAGTRPDNLVSLINL